ncbi:MAG: hypothetical protein GY942_10615 [Aestuariibacter sp.]|nr:hypothetical protein [Aestuariibacter sp.]
MLKNVAGQNITALLLDTDGAAVTTGTTTVYVTGDAGTQASMGVATHEGNGEWSIDVAQAESNYDSIGFTWINSGAVTVHQSVFTDQAYVAVSNIGSGSSGTVNIKATEDNSSGAIVDGVTKVGTITGDFNNVHADTAGTTIVSIEDVGNDIDFVLGYDVTNARFGSSVTIVANVNGNTDSMKITAYDHVGSSWTTVGILNGTGGATYQSLSVPLYEEHTGTGSELGKVYIRFENNGTTPALLEIDRCSVDALPYETGIQNGSTLTLAAATTNTNLVGSNWNLALGGQNIGGTYVKGATVTGVSSGTTPVTFEDCMIGTATLPPGTYIRCGFGGTMTAASDGDYFFAQCYSGVAGSGSPAFAFNGKGAATTINQRGFTGGASYTIDTNVTMSHEVLAGGGTTIDFSDSGGDAEIRGITRSLTLNNLQGGETVQFGGTTGDVTIGGSTASLSTVNLFGVTADVTDNTTGSGITLTDASVSQDNITSLTDTALAGLNDLSAAEVNTEVDTALGDYDGPTNAEMETRTPTAAQLAYMVANSATGVPVTFTTSGGTTTNAVLNQVDGAGASSTADQYNGRLLVFTNGTLKDVVTDITDYDGSNNATITAIPFAPTATHTARLI